MNTHYILYLSAALFSCGLIVVLTKRNAIFILIGVELMLNAANMNFVIFDQQVRSVQGQFFALFVILIAVCETAVGIAIIIKAFHYYQTSQPDLLQQLKERGNL